MDARIYIEMKRRQRKAAQEAELRRRARLDFLEKETQENFSFEKAAKESSSSISNKYRGAVNI